MSDSVRYDEPQGDMRTCRDAKFVRADEFLKLLLSRRELVRSDLADGSVRGLLDVQTGRRFLVRNASLFQR